MSDTQMRHWEMMAENAAQGDAPAFLELIAEVRRLREELETLEDCNQLQFEETERVARILHQEAERRRKAEAEVERLRAALQKYGRHRVFCQREPDCNCGFGDVLERLRGHRKKQKKE